MKLSINLFHNEEQQNATQKLEILLGFVCFSVIIQLEIYKVIEALQTE